MKDQKNPNEPDRIECPQCHKISYHPEDIKHKFCGNCDQWHEDMILG